MINLLPNEFKRQSKAARTNAILLNNLIILLFASGFIAIICFSTCLMLNNIKNMAAKVENSTTPYTMAKSKIDAINTNLSGANSILNNFTPYSSILTGIGSVLPTGVIIESISLSNASINSPVNITLKAKSNDVVEQLNQNFSGSSLFSGYSPPTNISTDPADKTGYPIIMNITVTINRTSAI